MRSVYVALIICILFASAQDYEDDLSVTGYNTDNAPVIILSPGTPDPLELSEGDDLYSRCSVQSTDQFTYRWIRRLPDGSEQQLSDSAVLYKAGIQSTDLQHPIICQVRRLSDGEVFEEMLNLRVETQPHLRLPVDLQLTIRSLPAEDLSQGRVMKQCLFENEDYLVNQFDFRWLDRSGRVVNNGDTLILLLENLVDLENYTCEATHRQSGTIYHAKYHVTPSLITEGTQYVVQITSLTPELLVGRPYEMMCEVTPAPDRPVLYRWYHNNQIIGEDRHLRLSSLAYPDIGTYICHAQWTPARSRTGSMAANATMELSLAVTRDIGIEMSPPPGSILVTLPGEMRELHCEFNSRNPQNVRWYFEGQPIEFHPNLNASGTVYRMDRMHVSIVSLRSVELSQAGTYECSIGTEVKQTHVIVRAEHGLEINPETDTVEEGSPVEFHCRAHGAKLQINREMQWFYRPFYGGAMVPLDLFSADSFTRQDDAYASHTSFISKSSAKRSDEGEYICRLQSEEVVSRLYVRSTAAYRVVITPSILKVRGEQPIQLECYVTDEAGRPIPITPKFRVRNPRIIYQTEAIGDNRSRFNIPSGLQSEHNGTQVECYTDQPGNTAIAVIAIEDTCPQGYRRCRSGQCIPAGRFCDGVPDCSDRSDEDPLFCNSCDPIVKECRQHQNRPPLKKEYMIHWECDGEDDCGNGFDEANCPDPLVARCGRSMFACQSGSKRIPLAFVCDKEQDCAYGEDEANCVAPTIQNVDNARQQVRSGDQVVLTCQVTGHPLPRVIWRFNWGCLPDEAGRFRVQSRAQNCDSQMPTVISTLTITNVRPGDDGIYNCEGLAGSTRAMSNDYFVMLSG